MCEGCLLVAFGALLIKKILLQFAIFTLLNLLPFELKIHLIDYFLKL